MGLAAVGGLEVGDAIQVLFASLGLSAVLAASATLFNIVKWAGVAYLVYTGIRTLMRVPVALDGDQAAVSTKQAFRQGIIVNALNPKTALFFLSIFPQFIDTASDHAQLQSLFLGAIFVVLATLFNGSYSLMASGLRHLLLRGLSEMFSRKEDRRCRTERASEEHFLERHRICFRYLCAICTSQIFRLPFFRSLRMPPLPTTLNPCGL